MKVFVIFQLFLCGVSASYLRRTIPVRQNGCNETLHNVTKIVPTIIEPLVPTEPLSVEPVIPTPEYVDVPLRQGNFFLPGTVPETDPDYVPDPSLYPYSIGGGNYYREDAFSLVDESIKLANSTDATTESVFNATVLSPFDSDCDKSNNSTNRNETGVNIDVGNVTISINGNGVNVTAGNNQTHIDTNHTNSGIHVHVGGVSVDIDDNGVEVDTNDEDTDDEDTDNEDYYTGGDRKKQVAPDGWYYLPKPTQKGN